MTTAKLKSLCLQQHEVRALLKDGRVTVVRAMKPQPPAWVEKIVIEADAPSGRWSGQGRNVYGREMHWPGETYLRCPLGEVGDKLAVKESFWVKHDTDSDDYREWDCGPCLDVGPEFHPGIQYRASPEARNPPEGVAPHPVDEPGDWWEGPPDDWDGESDYHGKGQWEFLPWGLYSKFSPVLLPAWASRFTVEVEAVRGKQVQSITEDEAKASGLEIQIGDGTGNGPGYKWDGPAYWDGHSMHSIHGGKTYHATSPRGTCYCHNGERDGLTAARCAFKHRWGKANGPDAWDRNPWVWLGEIRRVET
ncbi:MAG: hypothetical protein P4L67_04300 [Candidatus Pacebacteria bacterium]|nr:hypothetical protein [Candidatus Paceibacterota bacterium]